MPSPGYAGQIAAVRTGVGGLASNLNPSAIRLKNVIQAEGAIFREDLWRKEPGTVLFGTNATAVADPADLVVVALNDWHPTETFQRIVHLRGDGYIYMTTNGGSDPGAIKTTHTSGPGTRMGYFVTGGAENIGENRKLFLLRPNLLPSYIDGIAIDDTVFSFGVGPTNNFDFSDWSDATPPITGIVNGTRLWLAGNTSAPHNLYASKSQDHVNFKTGTGVSADPQIIPVFPGVGQRIFALANYQGFIVVFKNPRGIFLQDARDTDPLNWLTQQITDTIGVANSPYAALQLENDVLFLGSDGQFYLLSAVIAAATGQQNMETANIGMDLEIYQFLLNAYNRQRFDQIQSVYYPFWQTATFTVPGPAQTQNNTRLMFDFTAVGRKGGEPRFSYSYRDKAASIALRRDTDQIDKPMYGNYGTTSGPNAGSNIILLEQDPRSTWDDVAYSFRVQTPHTNLFEFESLSDERFVQFSNRNKLFDNLEIEYLPNTAAILTVYIYIDGILRQTLLVPLVSGGFILDVSHLDVDSLGIGQVRAVVHRLNCGSGRRISILFTNQVIDQDVAITHFYLGFRPGDTTQSPRTT